MAGRSQFGAVKEEFGAVREDFVGFTTVSDFVASLKSYVQNAEGLVFAEDILKMQIEGKKIENEFLQDNLQIQVLEKLRLEKECGDLRELTSRLREERDVLRDRLKEKEDLEELDCRLREEPPYVLRNRLKENEDLKELACRLREERDILRDRLKENEDLKELACRLREDCDVLRNRLKEDEDLKESTCRLREERDVLRNRLKDNEDLKELRNRLKQNEDLKELASHLREERDVLRNRLKENEDLKELRNRLKEDEDLKELRNRLKEDEDLKESTCRLREERDVLRNRLKENEDLKELRNRLKENEDLKELASHLREERDVLRNRLKENEDYQNKIVEQKRKNCETDVDIYQSRIKELEGKISSLGKDASVTTETNGGKRKVIREVSMRSEAFPETNANPSDGSSHRKRRDRVVIIDSDDEYASHESASEMVVAKRQLEKAHLGQNVAEHEPEVHEITSDMEIEKDASVNLTTTETNTGKWKVRENIVKSEALSKRNANPSDESPHKKRRVATPYCELHGRRRFDKYQGLAFGDPIPIVHDRASLLWTQCLTKDYRCKSRVNMSVPGEWYGELPTAVRARVDGTCFHSLIRGLVDGGRPASLICLTSLVERWSDTTHTFHLPIGELTITPLDVAAITGLSFEGSPPPFRSRLFEPGVDVDLVQDLTGIRFHENCRKRVIPYRMLLDRWRCIRTPVGADIDRYARAYLWYVLSCTLFHNTSSKADLAILEALRDLDNLGSYSWGSSALASIYRGLDARCRGSNSMLGLPLVVEIWGYEYEVLQSHWTEHQYHPGFPRLGHWGTRKDNKSNILMARQRLDAIAWDQICPHPWGVTDEGWLPEMVHARYVSSRRVLLEDNLDRSWYLGERVFDFDRGIAARRVPRPPPKLMFWGADLPDDVELEALMEGFPVEGYPGQPETALLEPFVKGAYETFITEHLLGSICSW